MTYCDVMETPRNNSWTQTSNHEYFPRKNGVKKAHPSTCHIPEMNPRIQPLDRVDLEAVVDTNGRVELGGELLLAKPLYKAGFTYATVTYTWGRLIV